ncbi:MAG: hypothetical protein GF347_02510 [Candidatus Moranbacteria bacterium]|nr:hypothetical protein [Candidatus Moranbacteria bacterium]
MPNLNNHNRDKKDSFFQIPEVCPSCSSKYEQSKVNVINNSSETIVVHVTCPNCKTSVISNISINNMRVMAVGMLTDLEKKDLKLIRKKTAIDVDDVIEMHELIEKEGCIKLT